MKIPYVIDNQTHRLADVLNALLAEHRGRSLDVATAYFTVGGFGLIKEGLLGLGNLRLLLGAEPTSGEQLGLRPHPGNVTGLIRQNLEALPFDEKTLRLVEDLIAYLRRNTVRVHLHDKGFLHAKCWLFYSDRPGQQLLFDRFRPIFAIVGSSNFTAPGLTSNRELNLAHKVLLDPAEVEDREAAYAVSWLSDAKPSERITPENRQLLKSEVGARAIIDLEQWYERQWTDGRDFKEDLIELLDASKFGRKEYTPYQVYMKALYEYFKDELAVEAPTATRSAVELAEFQEDAVKKARKILSRYDGEMIADSVGLGKTWIGKKLLEDFAYHLRQKALVVCPASLREMRERELANATISATVLSQEELGREEFDPSPWGDADVVLIDESHNFRNRSAQRYANIERLLGVNSGRRRDGSRKKVILLTATPINNDLFDLYNQFCLITRGDRSYFAACGIGDLYRYFLQARRDARTNSTAFALFNLLEEVVIRRTRPFIRKAYPEATIGGKRIHFPKRKLKTVRYDLEAIYAGIYDEVVSGIESLQLAPYNLEAYKKRGVAVDEFEAGREQALVGIFKSRYLKRFESSIEAFRISVRRMDSGADSKERTRIVQGFTPKANDKPDWVGTDKEIDVLISTDVLSEGQNLQDCGYLVNYDLHWNPTRMVQRAGRIDRIGTDFDTLWIYNMFPDEGLERLLGLVESLSRKIADIDRVGFLDASVLGETVHPQNFNTLRRIRDEDSSVIDEEEQFTEFASNEFLAQQLRALLDAGGREMLESLPDGIHSGLAKVGAKGVFFYFQAETSPGGRQHFWKYFALKDQKIIDNRYTLANLIACNRDTPRVVDPEVFSSVFDLQEKVIEDILRSVQDQRALEAAPRSVDPIQQTVATALQSYLNHPDVEHRQAIEAIRFLNQPILKVQVDVLRKAYKDFQGKRDVKALLAAVEGLREQFGEPQVTPHRAESAPVGPLSREDLKLICFDFISGG